MTTTKDKQAKLIKELEAALEILKSRTEDGVNIPENWTSEEDDIYHVENVFNSLKTSIYNFNQLYC